MNKLRLMACGLILGGFAVLVTAGAGNAAAIPAGGLAALPDYTADESLVLPVRHRHYHFRRSHRHDVHPRWRHRHRYDRRHHGRRFKHRRPRHRHYYRGYWYAFPWWLYSVPRRYYNRHVEWCLGRYRSYNPNTDMFLGYDGRYHRCRSPYRR